MIATVLLAAALAGPSLLDEAEEHFKAGRFAEAASALERAYADAPQPDLLFNWANAERLAGDCERAAQLYDRYLETERDRDDPTSQQYAEVATQRRDECVAEQPEPEREPEPAVSPPPAAEVEPSVTPPPQPRTPAPADEPTSDADWRRDAAGWTLTSLGIASVVTASGLLGGAFAREARATDELSHAAYLGEVRDVARIETAGWVMLGIGGAAVLGGVIRLAVVSARGRGRRRRGANSLLRARF